MDRIKRKSKTKLDPKSSGQCIPVYRNLFRTRTSESNNYSEGNRGNKRHRHNLNLPTIGLAFALLAPQIAHASDIGGVSATASPIANSSGSVTNQAIQVLQGPYITNTYGGGIQCQGSTLNITPFATGSASGQKPWEDQWWDNVYDMRDQEGATDVNGAVTGDGVPDNPGNILYKVPVRTGQKDTYNLSLGVSATWSIPLDKKAQNQCKEAAATQITLQQQLTANKRLDFEIARLKNCGELIQKGITFHPKSPYYAICADVMVNNVSYIKPHVHSVEQKSTSSSSSEVREVPVSSSADDLGGPFEIGDVESFQEQSKSSLSSSSQQVSPLSKEDRQSVLRAVQTWQQQRQLNQ